MINNIVRFWCKHAFYKYQFFGEDYSLHKIKELLVEEAETFNKAFGK